MEGGTNDDVQILVFRDQINDHFRPKITSVIMAALSRLHWWFNPDQHIFVAGHAPKILALQPDSLVPVAKQYNS